MKISITQPIEIKEVNIHAVCRAEKTRGEKMKVSPIMLLKKNIEKMSELGLAIMLQKINDIHVASHYINEKKGC